MLGPLLGSEVMVVERTMKRVRKRRVRRGKAAQHQVPGPDQRMMGEVWWREEGWTGPGEDWREARTGPLEGRWMGVERCLLLEPVGRSAAAAQKEDKLDFPFPLPAGMALGRVQRDTGEGGARVQSRRVVRGRRTVMGMDVQEQARILMENLKKKQKKNNVARANKNITLSDSLC